MSTDLDQYVNSPVFDHDLDLRCVLEFFDEQGHPINAAAVRLLIRQRDEARARLSEVEAERDAAEKALATIALEVVPPANRVTYVLSPEEIRGLVVAELAKRDQAIENGQFWHAEREAWRPVVEAAQVWRAMVKAWGGPLRKVPGSIHGAEELIAAVDALPSTPPTATGGADA